MKKELTPDLKRKIMIKKLTKSDEANLKECPRDVWFESIDVFPKVKRGTYSLGRLVEAGYLERVHTDPIPGWKYKVIK